MLAHAGIGQEDRMIGMLAKHSLLSLSLILFVASIAAAQAPTTGRLTGTVKDPSGAIVPGTAIQAKGALTGSEFTAATNEIGVRVMPSVTSESCSVRVNAQGLGINSSMEMNADTGAPDWWTRLSRPVLPRRVEVKETIA
jgi:hypothetical protein